MAKLSVLTLRLSRGAQAASLALVVLGLGVGSSQAASADTVTSDGGITIEIEVLGPPLAATPQTAGGSGSGGFGAGGDSAVDDPPAVEDGSEDEGDGDDEGSGSGGVINLSGLHGDITPTVSPAGGTAKLTIAATNNTDYLMDVKLHFWLQNLLGATIAEIDDVHLADFEPGETREKTIGLYNIGQWGIYTAHVTATPPTTVGGVDTSPISREATLIVPPYFLLLIATLVALIYVAVRYLAARRARYLAGVPA